ncbi:MAG TPA: sn-glycerol-3-phosphate ABC transporter ATP-binding protein UgpC [Burkholderiales bacterium]|nr:sn-glycerol-3-phosphate ABC transporter ATP-binding protein UgpC [Burkholderiales bacterium]
MSSLTLRNVRKAFGTVEVLKGIDLHIESGEFLILVGPSGCGKSTLLNIIAGLDGATSGDVLIGDRVVNDVNPKDRDIAMVFQSYALYPNMTVRQNIAFGLEMRRVPRAQREEIVERVAAILRMGELLDRKPGQLSGGQRQRVAMGRAIARDPQLFLFDEPLSNLDARLRVEMRAEIRQLHERLRATTVYVTHDQIEAMTLGSRIAVMQGGEVRQFGTPQEIYDRPADLFVAGFIGSPPMNFIRAGVVEDAGGTALRLEAADGGFLLPLRDAGAALRGRRGRQIVLGIRPEQVSGGEGRHEARNLFVRRFVVEFVEPTGPDTLVFVRINGEPVCCRVKPDQAAAPGRSMELAFDLGRAALFDPDSGRRLD